MSNIFVYMGEVFINFVITEKKKNLKTEVDLRTKKVFYYTFFRSFLIEISLSGACFRTALIVPFQLNLPRE